MSEKKKLFIIDAMAMAFRNFHAFGARPLTTSSGFPTSAIFGSANFILRLIEQENPDYLLIASDTAGPTFRHDIYEAYKANRGEMPEDLGKQIPVLFRLFEALKIPLLKESQYEADDLIGSVVSQFHNENLDCYIVSGDKDFMQLINEQVFLYSPKKGGVVNIIDFNGVNEKFGCRPDQVIDILALMGDASDNVPGVKGIGEKGAAKLIAEFHSLDGIYSNLDQITNKRQHTGLSENKEMAYLSQKLVTIKIDIPIDQPLEHFRFDYKQSLANTDLLEFFQEMEFDGLRNKIKGIIEQSNKSEDAIETKAPENLNYKLVNTQEDFSDFLQELKKAKTFSFDTETTGLNINTDKPIGISFSWQAKSGYYVPIIEKHLEGITPDEILTGLKPVLTSDDQIKVAHNLKFDMQMLQNIGINVSGPIGDTMIAAFIIDASDRFGLDHCSKRYLGIEKIPTSELIGKKAEIKMEDVPLDKLSHYACEDADCCYRLNEIFVPTLENKKLSDLYHNIDMPIVPILAKIEKAGIHVDAEVLDELSHRLAKRAKELESEIFEIAGEDFNIGSTKQLQYILFEKLKINEALGIKKLKKTKTGYSTDVTVLESLSEHPLPALILEYRSTTKLKSTYVDALPQLIDPSTNRIHTSFHQTGTQTGRFSSSDPNLQNIPIRTEQGREIRKAFKAPSADRVIIAADYSQIELRILAHISQDKNLLAAFQSNHDIHTATAATMFKKPISEVDREDRSRAKAINYGIVYGMGPRRLSKTTNVSLQEAKNFIESYFESFPNIQIYIDQAIQSAREKGYSETICHRRRPIDGLDKSNGLTAINAQNIAVNSPIQGSASDLIKIAMIQVDKALEESKLDVKMLLQVHDELVFEASKKDAEAAKKIIVEGMEKAMELKVPIVADISQGQDWLEAH